MAARTGPLGEWMAGLPVRQAADGRTVRRRADREILVGSGVDGQDLTAYRRAVLAAKGQDLAVDVAANRLCTELIVLAITWPDLSVRDGVGWVLVASADPRPVSHVEERVVPWNEVEEFATAWEAFGLLDAGWLFAAAGLDVAEARDMAAAGLVDEDALVALAALRGVPIPATG